MRAAKAAELREQGLSLRQIGDTLGVSTSTVQRLLYPERAERDRIRSLELKRLRTGVCINCGATTRYSGGRGKAISELCRQCAADKSGAERTIWTPEKVINCIQEWAAEHDGDPPAVTDWNPVYARKMNDEDRATRFESNRDRWPWFTSVIRVFGSWNAAIEAAGFAPRAKTGSHANVARRRDQRAKAAA